MSWDFAPNQPIYTQLIDRLRRAIAAGEYPSGSRLPAVRELAAEAGINPNTVQRALGELEREGLIYAQRTAGRYVTDDPAAITAARRELAATQVRQYLSSMRALGFSVEEAAALAAEMKEKEDENDEQEEET